MIRQSDIKALVPLLEQDWDSPEELSRNLINTLDKLRASRGFYAGVLQFGDRTPIYVGLGPYPGAKSAEKAIVSHPSAGMAVGVAVVPVMTPTALAELVTELDTPPKKRETKPKRGR